MVKGSDYQSYLLRFWRVGGDGPRWRAMLQDLSSGEHVSFASLDDLCAFLRLQLGVKCLQGKRKHRQKQTTWPVGPALAWSKKG
jgi:hypothetical protein